MAHADPGRDDSRALVPVGVVPGPPNDDRSLPGRNSDREDARERATNHRDPAAAGSAVVPYSLASASGPFRRCEPPHRGGVSVSSCSSSACHPFTHTRQGAGAAGIVPPSRQSAGAVVPVAAGVSHHDPVRAVPRFVPRGAVPAHPNLSAASRTSALAMSVPPDRSLVPGRIPEQAPRAWLGLTGDRGAETRLSERGPARPPPAPGPGAPHGGRPSAVPSLRAFIPPPAFRDRPLAADSVRRPANGTSGSAAWDVPPFRYDAPVAPVAPPPVRHLDEAQACMRELRQGVGRFPLREDPSAPLHHPRAGVPPDATRPADSDRHDVAAAAVASSSDRGDIGREGGGGGGSRDDRNGDNEDDDDDDDPSTLNMRKMDIGGLKEHRVIYIVGKRGSGKTVLLEYLLMLMRKRFDIVMAMSETAESVATLRKFIPHECVHEKFDADRFTKLVTNAIELAKQGVRRHILILLDDCMRDKSIMNLPAMRELHYNGRHGFITFINLVQYLMDVPKWARGQIDYAFAFAQPQTQFNRPIWENLFSVIGSYEEEFLPVFYQVTENRGILVADNTNGSNRLEDVIFWFRAVKYDHTPQYHLGNRNIWKLHHRFFEPSHNGLQRIIAGEAGIVENLFRALDNDEDKARRREARRQRAKEEEEEREGRAAPAATAAAADARASARASDGTRTKTAGKVPAKTSGRRGRTTTPMAVRIRKCDERGRKLPEHRIPQ